MFAPSTHLSEALVKEFYATIHPNRGDVVRVSGKFIGFSPSIINTHFGLWDVFDAVSNEIVVHATDEQVEEARKLIFKPHKSWIVSS